MEDRTGHLVLARVRQALPWGPGEREKLLSQCPVAHRAGGRGDPAHPAHSPDSAHTQRRPCLCWGDPLPCAGLQPSLADVALAPRLAGAPGEQLVIFRPE